MDRRTFDFFRFIIYVLIVTIVLLISFHSICVLILYFLLSTALCMGEIKKIEAKIQTRKSFLNCIYFDMYGMIKYWL